MVYPSLQECNSSNKDRQIKETIFLCNFMAHIHGIKPKYLQLKLEVVKNAKHRDHQPKIDVLLIF